MKKIILLAVLYFGLMNFHADAQRKASANEDIFGSHFNLGLGLGYYGYIGSSLPVFMLNYEIDVASNVTVAPFVGFYSYSSSYYLININNLNRYYSYRETVIPLGAKGYYYFDKILNAESNWDFYGAASLGFNIRTISWESGVPGDKSAVRGASPLYLDIHLGSRYHFNDKFSMFVDLSTGVSTVGVTF